MHDRLGCWVDSVNQEINTSWKTKNKRTLHVYGDNHRIIESNIRGCAVCRRPHQCFISSWMSMAWMVRTQKRDNNETESGLLTANLHKWSPHKTMDRKIKPPDLFSQRGIVFNYLNLLFNNNKLILGRLVFCVG